MCGVVRVMYGCLASCVSWLASCVTWLASCVAWLAPCVAGLAPCVAWLASCVAWPASCVTWLASCVAWLSSCVAWLASCVTWLARNVWRGLRHEWCGSLRASRVSVPAYSQSFAGHVRPTVQITKTSRTSGKMYLQNFTVIRTPYITISVCFMQHASHWGTRCAAAHSRRL